MSSCANYFRKQRGTVAAEMAVITPVFMLLLVGIAELGNAYYQYNTLNKAVRDGARYLAGEARSSTGLIDLNRINQQGIAVGEAARRLVVYGEAGGNGTPVLNQFATGQVTISSSGAEHVDVGATYPYQSLFGGSLPNFGFGAPSSTAFNFQASVVMRVIN